MEISSESSKDAIRQKLLDWRGSLEEGEWSTRSRRVCNRLLDEIDLTDSSVMVYAAKNREVNLAHLVQTVPETSEVCLPVTNTDSGTLDVYRLVTPTDLLRSLEESRPVNSIVLGAHDIMEPDPAENQPIDPAVLDFVLVPGLAFDGEGNRIGYGEGYYDRFLSQLDDTTLTVGVGFDEQLLADDLPVSDHDVPVDRVATDRRMK